jgi:hypothetical protein
VRTRRTAAFAALIIAAVGAVPSAALADTTTTSVIYVDGSSSDCTDSGTGTSAAPFCTLQAGVDTAVAGDTVEVSGSVLYAPVTISVSGTAAAPITIQGQPNAPTYVGSPIGTADPAPGFTIDGARHVTVSDLRVTGASTRIATVTGSSEVTLDRIEAVLGASGQPAYTQPGIEIAGSSSDVTISRSTIRLGALRTAPAVQIDSGSSGDVVTTNEILDTSNDVATSYPAEISVLGAADTAVTSNTVDLGVDCGSAVSVTGASGGTTIENNILQTTQGDCLPGTVATALVSVSDSAAAPVTSDYNLLYPSTNQYDDLGFYDWNGTLYPTLGSFTTATGEGAHDLAAQPDLDPDSAAPTSSSPAINAANSAAPGMLGADLDGDSCSYDPYVAITGAGSPAYCSRGALQYQSQPLNAAMQASWRGALQVEVFDGEPLANPQGYAYSWGDGQTTNSMTPTATHTYAEPGTYTITETVTDAIGGSASNSTTYTTQGNDYTPYGPLRLLDTRKGIGAPESPIQSGFLVKLQIAGNGAIPDNVTAVALNLTAVNGTSGGYITAYADGTSAPDVSNLNYNASAPVANAASVPVGADGYIDLLNTGGTHLTTVDLIADVAGYFSPTAASGFDGLSPARILDTRKAIGAAKAKVGAFSTIPLTIAGADSGLLPKSGITAVSLHVTEVDATAGGYVTVFPDGTKAPTASSLNYTVGNPVANTVIVPVPADGEVDLYNASAGSVDLVADVTGFYTTAVGADTGVYVPVTPYRLVDTRKTSALSSEGSVSFAALGSPNSTTEPSLAYATNLTVTDPTSGGYITAYPTGSGVPDTSNLNYVRGETVANLAQTIPGSSGRITIANSEPGGTVEVIVDEFGYYTHD